MNKQLISLTEVLNTSSQKLRNKWCKQLLYKLNIIHNAFQIAQCNICLDNFKVDKNNNLNLVNVSEKPGVYRKIPIDVKFLAPELLGGNIRSKAGDIWATGICIFFINNLYFPWKIATNNDIKFYSWANDGIFPTNLDNSYLEAAKKMLSVEPQMRPSIKNVIKMTLDRESDGNSLSKFLWLNSVFLSYLFFI